MRAAFVGLLAFAVPMQAQVDFGRDVLPILSDQCFHCHGPDEGARKGRLRLDTQAGATRERNGVAAVVPGNLKESELYRRITSTDADEQMPPPNSNRKLTAKQIDTLTQWIDGGAKWGGHWAFEKVKADGPGSIDSFIRDRLRNAGLTPAPPATKASWLRRVTFDLTGLPPTLAEIDTFDKDSSPNAFEKQVDRLLASPRYGERMAADWLDVARFADTHGYQMDRDRPVWPYRDWVIRAFNANEPFDQFMTEQLAGDLLPKATQEQQLATAFNRLHMQNEEGGIVEEEFRVANVNDRVTTFGTAFLGLTLECARCHDHKYDPITQKDYYSFFALFQNIDESGQTSYFTAATPVPALPLTTAEQEKKRAELRKALEPLAQALYAARIESDKAFAAWKRPAVLPEVGLIAHFKFDELKANRTPNAINEKQPGTAHDGPKLVAGQRGQAVALTGENGFRFPGVGDFSKADPFSISLWLKADELAPRAVVLHHSRAPIDAGSRGYELLLENGHVAFGMHHMWPGNSLKVRTKTRIAKGEWTHVAVASDGSGRAAGLKIFVNGTSHKLDTVRDDLTKDIVYEGGEPDLAIGDRFRDNGFRGGAIDELKLFDRAIVLAEAKQLAGVAFGDDDDFQAYFTEAIHQPSIDARKALQKARRELAKFEHSLPEIMTMRELPTPKPAFVLKRGQYDAPGEPVTAGVPAWLNAWPEGAPKNRLGLAKWLLEKDNPLFARVTVNRLWQQMFGTGLVETSDNFGTQGTGPTHPELLDWLANDFRRDWDVKRMLKMMALSATYRQSSETNEKTRQVDPANALLSHAPVRKLSAEMLRDQALFASGLLVEKQGGPSVRPYQPDGLWDLAMGRPKYVRSTGADLYRRSLYTYVKRTAPHPQMQTFDAADRSNCAVKRQSTSTPLQALARMNDPQIVEAARALAVATTDIGVAFRTILGRPANEKELAVLAKLMDTQKAKFTADANAAKAFLAVGDTKHATDDPATLAARTVVVLTLLNHDEAVQCR
jgi:mono/diheme cytochrome c family protein